MALPTSAPKVTCTLSKPLHAEGTVGSITSAFLTIDRTLVWAASGETIYLDPVSVDPLVDGLSFQVIPVDALGVLDLAGNLVTNWKYTLRVSLLLDDGQEKTVTYDFQPMMEDVGGAFDLDLVPQLGAVSVPPATVGGELVTIIVGDPSPNVDGGSP